MKSTLVNPMSALDSVNVKDLSMFDFRGHKVMHSKHPIKTRVTIYSFDKTRVSFDVITRTLLLMHDGTPIAEVHGHESRFNEVMQYYDALRAYYEGQTQVSSPIASNPHMCSCVTPSIEKRYSFNNQPFNFCTTCRKER